MRHIATIIFSLLISQNALASSIGPVEIEKIQVDHRGTNKSIYVAIKATAPLTGYCTNTNLYKHVVLTADTAKKLDRLYSLALTARISKTPVELLLNSGCSHDFYSTTSLIVM